MGIMQGELAMHSKGSDKQDHHFFFFFPNQKETGRYQAERYFFDLHEKDSWTQW